MNKYTFGKILCVLFVLLTICFSAYASDITPYADSEFISATASLSTRKDVSFYLLTKADKETIKVTACWLQKKSGSEWVKVCNLDAPTVVMHNMSAYGAVMDYSASIGTGTYRVGFTADADGHTITRYSNERTF